MVYIRTHHSLATALLYVAIHSKDETGTLAFRMRECIQPVRTEWWEECPVPVVAQEFCHDPDTCQSPGSAPQTDVCTLIAHSIYLEFEIFDAVFLHAGLCHDKLPAGPLSPEQIHRVLPNRQELVALQINGSELIAALEHGIDENHFQNNHAAYPKVAGMRFQVDLNQSYGSRISNVETMNTAACGWKPLNVTKTYHVMTNEALAHGGYGYVTLTRARGRTPSGFDLANALWYYAQSVCTVRDPFRRPVQGHVPKKINEAMIIHTMADRVNQTHQPITM